MIVFVILHYQALEETKTCVETIMDRVLTEKRIVIVDNCSPNKSGELLQDFYQNYQEIKVELLDSNVGFAKGNNIGYRMAKLYNPQYIIVMNNDVLIDSYDLEFLLEEAFRDSSFDILGPDIISTRDGIHQNPQRLRNFSLEELKRKYISLKLKNCLTPLLRIKYMIPFLCRNRKKGSNYIDHPVEDVVLHGACYIYSHKFIADHENCLFDGTFMYFESYILHYLALREGIKLVYDPRITVKHHEDVSTDLTYGRGYKKAVFSNRCLLESCRVFMEVIQDQAVRI